MTRPIAILLWLAALAPRSPLDAQALITVDGRVRSDAGGLAGASVSAVDTLTNERRAAVTDQRGYFRIVDVSPGRYTVLARAVGYTPAVQTADIATGQRVQLELVLERAPVVLETVVVQERPDEPEIQRTSISTAVTTRQIQGLPLNTRNVMELASIAPGIRSFRTLDGRSLPAAGALRDERAINFYIDGVELKNFTTGNLVGTPHFGSPLPAEGLQELRVFLNPYDAEYGRGAAYVISAVSQRGTNEPHASAFGFFQNKGLISVTDFQRAIPNFAKPDFSRRQGGFNLRGPIVHDRLFYAVSYELSDIHNYIAVVPGRPPSDPGHWDSYAGVFDAPTRNQTAIGRLTFAPNLTNSLDAIWTWHDLTGEGGFGGTDAHEAGGGARFLVNTVKLRHRWLPAARLANELSVQLVDWTHDEWPLVEGPELVYGVRSDPTLRIGRANVALRIDETRVHLTDRVSYSAGNGPGSHLLKAGVELARVGVTQVAPTARDGLFTFRAEGGSPDQAQIAVGATDPASDRDARSTLAGWVLAGYVNDEWQPGARLSLNLGIRYDAEINTLDNRFTVPWASDTILTSKPELSGLLNRGDRKNDLNNVSPRLAASWDVTGSRRTFLRGGFGIVYDRVPGFIAFNEQRSATWRTYTFTTPGTTDPAELRARVIAGGGTVPPSIVLLPHTMEAPENRQWSIGLGAQLTRRVTLNTDYIDQDVRKLFASVNLNWLDRSRTPARRALTGSYGNVTAWGAFARGRYRALLTTLSYRVDSATWLDLAHTLGSAKADWDVENVPGGVPASAASGFYVMQRISGDERHRFVLSGMWTPRAGYSLSTVVTVASPRPYRTWVGQDVNGDNVLEDDWIDGRRYRVPANAWRNWYRMVDLRFTRTFDLGRGARLSIIGEAFNLFNSENYADYFGVQKSDAGAPRPDFGAPSEILATRQLQIATRVQF